MELKVNFKEAHLGILQIPDYKLPKSKLGDTVILFDDDIECDCRITGRVRVKGKYVFLVAVPPEVIRDVI